MFLLKLLDVNLTIGLILEIGWIVWHYMFINILAWIVMSLRKKLYLDISIVCVIYVCNICLEKLWTWCWILLVMLNIAKLIGRC